MADEANLLGATVSAPGRAGAPGTSGVPARPRRRLSWKKKAVFAAVTVCLGLSLLIGGAEAAGRVYIHFKYGVPGKSYGINEVDEELGATHRPNSYNTNATLNNLGFRNAEDVPDAKPAGGLRVYCSGGSTTYCYNLSNEEAWPARLQERLRALPGHEHDQVLNAGQICFSLGHEYALARRFIPRLKPDVVILFTGINEGMNANNLVNRDGARLDQLLAEGRWGVISKLRERARSWKRYSVLARLYEYKVKHLLEAKAATTFRTEQPSEAARAVEFHPWVIANLEHALRSYLGFLRENGCKVVIVRYGDNGTSDWYVQRMRAWRERVVAVGREEGATICDVASAVEKDPARRELFISSGVHVTKKGADLMADQLLKVLVEGQRPGAAAKP
jgi:lysophospholipase L1-like esterase